MVERILTDLADGSLAAIRYWLEASEFQVNRRTRGRRRRARPATGSQQAGFCASGAQFYVWQEERAEAESWADSLAPLDDATREPGPGA